MSSNDFNGQIEKVRFDWHRTYDFCSTTKLFPFPQLEPRGIQFLSYLLQVTQLSWEEEALDSPLHMHQMTERSSRNMPQVLQKTAYA